MENLDNRENFDTIYPAKKGLGIKIFIWILVSLLILAAGYFLGYYFGNKDGYLKGDLAGYKKAQEDQKSLQEAAARKATDEALKAANPFDTANPLENVEANPFEKTKKILNPF